MKISSLLLFFPTAHAVTYPVGITNCGLSSWITEKPSRAITLNQGTTEIMLALGLADSMVGTAYLDDEIWPEVAEDYTKVPILSDTYPTAEQVLELDPDFLYASYSSAFSTKGINYTTVLDVQDCALVVPRNENENRTFCRQELHDQDISTYLQEPFCELVEHRSDEVTMDVLFKEIWDIANIFDVYENGRTLVDSIDYHFDQAIRVSQSVTSDAAPIRVLWLDSWNEETPYVGACCGAVQVILEHAGVENIFADLGVEEKRSWESASWDDVVELDPDLIILVDASWSPADEKLANLCRHEKTRQLRAVQNQAFISVPFSGSTLGVRVGSLAYNLAEAMAALARGRHLSLVEFSDISLSTGGSQAVTKSGVKVYTTLPTWNGTDLNEACPGSPVGVVIADIPVETENGDDSKLPSWSIAVIAVFGVAIVAVIGFLMHVINKEKQGQPLFEPIKTEATAA